MEGFGESVAVRTGQIGRGQSSATVPDEGLRVVVSKHVVRRSDIHCSVREDWWGGC